MNIKPVEERLGRMLTPWRPGPQCANKEVVPVPEFVSAAVILVHSYRCPPHTPSSQQTHLRGLLSKRIQLTSFVPRGVILTQMHPADSQLR